VSWRVAPPAAAHTRACTSACALLVQTELNCQLLLVVQLAAQPTVLSLPLAAQLVGQAAESDPNFSSLHTFPRHDSAFPAVSFFFSFRGVSGGIMNVELERIFS